MVVVAATLALIALSSLSRSSMTLPVPAARAGAGSRPVVLELFTSEGCSSCPPADALLKQLDGAGRLKNAEIIAIEEHVDYWDHLGWRDPFSSHQWTERQEQYAQVFRRDGIYTPQLVINGSSEVAGSSTGEVQQKIVEAANVPGAGIGFTITAVSSHSAGLSIAIPVAPPEARAAELWLAVTERGLSSNVASGENEGRNLTHAAVLRSLTRVKLPNGDRKAATETSVTVELDPSWRRENLRFVIFLQDPKTLRIFGAAASVTPGNLAEAAQ